VKKTALTLVVILALSVSVMNGIQPVGLAYANFMYQRTGSPPLGAVPLTVSVSSPENNTIYRTNNITLSFGATAENTSLYGIRILHYKTDWLPDDVLVYQQESDHPYPSNMLRAIAYNKTYQIPDGEHSLIINASGSGMYDDPKAMTVYTFWMKTILVTNFTIDTVPPNVTVLPFQNGPYNVSDVPLNFVTNEVVSQTSYVLDGLQNVTINGNTTLTELANGKHDITVYGYDIARNVGVSETVSFIVAVAEPFPTTIVATASASVAIVSVGLLVHFKKRKR
jgi:hypothetical protein